MYQTLFEQQNSEHLILTANSRLSNHLIDQFDQYMHKSGETAWTSLKSLPLSTWINTLFHQRNDTGLILLSDFQEQSLWEKIILASDKTPELIAPVQTAKLVKQAWQYLTQWQVPLQALEDFDTQIEAQCLMTWVSTFQEQLEKNHWITTAELPHFLIQHKDNLVLPQKLTLVGFDHLSPAILSLLNHLKNTVIIDTFKASPHDNALIKTSAADTEDEIKLMAATVKNFLDENPTARIACVIPDLGNLRDKVIRLFHQALDIGVMLPDHPFTKSRFNLSAGKSLDQHTMIKAALTLLDWACAPLPIDELAELLQSPFLCESDIACNMGAHIDQLARENGLSSVPINALFPHIEKSQHQHPKTQWLLKLRHFQTVVSELPEVASPGLWTHHFIALLKAFHWPGTLTQNSNNFQLFERFKKCLKTYESLNIIYSQVSLENALKSFKTLLRQTIFQPKSQNEPIQILGALEATGLSFDFAWVMGLHDGVWPAAAKPNPFIPVTLAKEYDLPHATAKRELEYTTEVTERLKYIAPRVIFSTPNALGDQLLQPSALLNNITYQTLTPPCPPDYRKMMMQSQKLEQINQTPHLPVIDASNIRGGSSLLKFQAQCPFKAFAAFRLSAKSLVEPSIGIDKALQGDLVHQALYYFYQDINDQATLHQQSDQDISLKLSNAIDQTYRQNLPKRAQTLPTFFLRIEKQRTKKLVHNWITYDSDRPYFKIMAREKPMTVTLGTLNLNLRIDRIDVLSDQSLLLIDYKTGNNTITPWFTERLTEPQLPLYASALNNKKQPVKAMAFAEIRANSVSLKGVIAENSTLYNHPTSSLTPLEKVKANSQCMTFEEQLNQWENQLKMLAGEFLNGETAAAPDKLTTCQFCEFKPLCRYKSE